MKHCAVLFCCALIFLLACSGCTSKGANTVPATLTPAIAASETATATTSPVATVAVPETATITPDPFPDALTPGTWQEWKNGNMTLRGTVRKTILADTFDYHSISWGQWVTWYPEDPGSKYLFVFLKLVNGGSDVGRMPSPSQFMLYSNGSWYSPDTEQLTREPDPSTGKNVSIPLRISGQDVFEEDYQVVYDAGYIYAGESNSVNAYLIYHVPGDLDPARTYLQGTFTNGSTGIWKLGAGTVTRVTAVPTTIVPTVTRTAAPTVAMVPYTEIFRDSGYYWYYKNGKKSFNYTLTKAPLVINYSVVPEYVNDIKITGSDTNMKEVPINYADPDSWFHVTVTKAGTTEIVLQEGFGKGLNQDTRKTVMIRNPGAYSILVEGNKINVSVLVSAPS